MRYLIDGYNLFFKSGQIDPFHDKRQAMIGDLSELLLKLRLEASIIFDYSSPYSKNTPSTQVVNGVEIIYPPQHESADTYLLEMISGAAIPSELTVVTSDKALAKQARERRAHTLTIDQFLRLLSYKQKKSRWEKKPLIETQFERLLKIFEERVHIDDED